MPPPPPPGRRLCTAPQRQAPPPAGHAPQRQPPRPPVAATEAVLAGRRQFPIESLGLPTAENRNQVIYSDGRRDTEHSAPAYPSSGTPWTLYSGHESRFFGPSSQNPGSGIPCTDRTPEGKYHSYSASWPHDEAFVDELGPRSGDSPRPGLNPDPSDPRTSLIVRGIQSRRTLEEVCALLIKLGFGADCFDYMYMPVRRAGGRRTNRTLNHGYLFVNCVTAKIALDFSAAVERSTLGREPPGRAEVTYSHAQGKESCMEEFRKQYARQNSPTAVAWYWSEHAGWRPLTRDSF